MGQSRDYVEQRKQCSESNHPEFVSCHVESVSIRHYVVPWRTDHHGFRVQSAGPVGPAGVRVRAGLVPHSIKSVGSALGYPQPVDSEPRDEDVQFLEDRINEHNMMRTGRRDYQPLALYQRDNDNTIVAGPCGFTWAGWLEVKFLWVNEILRGQGIGRRLLEAAEAEARARGCTHVWLDSYTFQAPTFYEHLGYEVFGRLRGYPPPEDRVFLSKAL